MSKKEILARIIDGCVPTSWLVFIQHLLSKKLTVLAYHRVTDARQEDWQFDYGLISASIEDFEYQIKHIKRFYSPISMEQLVEHMRYGTKLPGRPLLVTFDDGFDDNYKVVFPILKKYAVPATIFISTGYIGKMETIWFDKIVAIIKNTDSPEFKIDALDLQYKLSPIKNERENAIREIMSRLKKISNKERLDILGALFRLHEDEFNKLNIRQSKMMTWKEVKEMSDSLVSFGSHAVSHPILTSLTESELHNEINESKSAIESHTGQCVDSISYPNGGRADYNEDVIRVCREAGYTVGFTYIGGENMLPIKNNFLLNRVHIEREVGASYFKLLLCFPNVFI